MKPHQIFVVPQASEPSKKHKTTRMAHQSLQQKLVLTQLKNKGSQVKMWLRNTPHVLYQKK